MNYYEILEVAPNARPEVIRAAYKSLMQQYHPDRNPNDPEASKRSTLITQAYEILSDANKRAAYDLTLKQIAARTRQVQYTSQINIDNKPEEQSRVMLWLMAMIAIALVWAFLMWSMKFFGAKSKVEPVTTAAHKQVAEPLAPQLDSPSPTSNSPVSKPTVTTKIISNYLNEINVNLGAGEKQHVLLIPVLDLLIGTQEQDAVLHYIEKNKITINNTLLSRLADCKYEMLISEKGEAYLKNFIADVFNEILLTNHFKPSPPGERDPQEYAGVMVDMPKLFFVK